MGKVAEHSLLGYVASLFGIHVDTSAPRGRTLDGGTIWSLGIKVPRGDSSGEGRAAHGPLHPAVNRSLETWMAPLFVFLLWSWFCHLVDCIAFLSLGLVACMVFEPFKPRPVFGFCLCPSSFLLYGWFCRRRVFFSSPSLSGAGETQTFLVWVSPCVFVDTLSHLDPYLEVATYSQVTSRTCFFFSDAVRLSGGGWSWLVVVAVGLSLSLFFFLGGSVAR